MPRTRAGKGGKPKERAKRHAVEGGNGTTARVLVLIVSALALVILTMANRLTSNPFGPRQTAL